MRKVVSLIWLLALCGCAYNGTLIPRDFGKTHSGEFTNRVVGSGSMTVRIGDNTCTGPAVEVASNESFGFAKTYGYNSRGQSINSIAHISTSGDVTVKATLSCSDGGGLRCDMKGHGSSGGGICLDDKGKVYDAIAIRK